MSKSPFFSIIIATYNRASLIEKTIQSILAQEFDDFELLIVDDGSTDNTAQVLKPYLSDKVFYFHKQNAERGAARNYGIDKAKGEFLTFIDSDDLMYSHHLKVAYQFLSTNHDVVFYGQGYETKNQLGQLLIAHQEVLNPNQALLKGNFLSCIGVFMKRDHYLNEGFSFSENRAFSGTEDWACWLQIAARHRLCYQNVVTACMVEHDARSVLHFKESQLLDRCNLLIEILQGDLVFKTVFGEQVIRQIYAHMLSYGALHLALSRQKKAALSWYWKAININFQELFSRRFLATIKILIFK
jgi:glycosyltransferase involved in cell wall biosynthesis